MYVCMSLLLALGQGGCARAHSGLSGLSVKPLCGNNALACPQPLTKTYRTPGLAPRLALCSGSLPCAPISMSLSLCLGLGLRLGVCVLPFVRPSVRPSIRPSVRPSIRLSLCVCVAALCVILYVHLGTHYFHGDSSIRHGQWRAAGKIG